MPKKRFNKIWYVIAMLALGNFALWVNVRGQGAPALAVHFLDTGQGDAIYLRTFQGNDVLVDAGPGDSVLSELGRAMRPADRTIEIMILTHPHADHVSGMNEVLKRYKVEHIMLAAVDYESETFRNFLKLAAAEQANIIRPALGQRVFLDDFTVMDVLYPIRGSFAKSPADINDSSIVARVSFGQSQVLLMGDAGTVIEQVLLDAELPLAAEILKVGHHGSRHSSSRSFLGAVQARYAVIQVGDKNRYGHPHPEVLDALAQQQIDISRTDAEGTVKFLLYPDRIEKQ